MMGTVTGWFEKHRALAVSLVSAGMGMAPMTISPFASWLIQTHDWRTAQMWIAILAWAVLVPTSLLVRPAPPPSPTTAAGAGGVASPGMTVGGAMRSPQFIVLGLTFFLCCATHSGPIFHTVSYAIACGSGDVGGDASAEGLAGLAGRLVLGLAADRFGAKRVLVIGLLVQAVMAGAYFFARQLGEFYAVAVVFGFAYGGVMPLYAVIAREYFPMHLMGRVFGGAVALSSLGMAFGPLAGGWVFDTYASYGWLYIGSFGVGLGAAAIALAFPPFAAHARPAAQGSV